MNKVLTGLLIVAAGAGCFFFFRNKKYRNNPTIQKELLVGQWKLDSLHVKTKDSNDWFKAITAIDSDFSRHRFDFRTDGTVLQSVTDSAKADTLHFKWSKKNALTWKENPKDSTSEMFTVTKLNSDCLLLQSKDSSAFYFSKLK